MELIAFNARPKTEEHMLMVMDKSTHGRHLHQALQTNKKQFKLAISFLSGYNGIFNVTNSNNKFFSRKQLLTKMIFFKLLYHQVPMKLNH